MKLAPCGEGGGAKRRLLVLWGAPLALVLVLAQLLAGRPGEAARVGRPARQHDELIEGRLDTGQLCGTRYSGRRGQPEEAEPGEERAQSLLYIVGGDEVEDDQFWPWSVAIHELDPLNGQRQFICSGSLISDRFILTAAHCIQQSRFDILSANEVFVKLASVRLDDERAHFYHIEAVHVHPEYSVDRKANDIALLKLGHGQRLPARARPICLPSQLVNRVDFTDQQVTVIGWGKTDAQRGDEPARLIEASLEPDRLAGGLSLAGAHTNDTLYQAEVRVTSTEQCNRSYSKLEISWLQIDDHFMCASDPLGKRDACQGDSGGPLMWNRANQPSLAEQRAGDKWYQLGLVSFGHGCANSQFPGVYTRISYYMPWILRTVNGRNALLDAAAYQQHQQATSNSNYNHNHG